MPPPPFRTMPERKHFFSQEGFPKDDTTSRCEFARYLHRVTSSSGAHLVSAEVTPVLVTRDQWGAETDLFLARSMKAQDFGRRSNFNWGWDFCRHETSADNGKVRRRGSFPKLARRKTICGNRVKTLMKYARGESCWSFTNKVSTGEVSHRKQLQKLLAFRL